MKEIYIIGGGLGGLFAGALQAKKGRKVTVLEKNDTPGGGLQTFTRQVGERCEIFETGMHLLGGFREDGAVRILLKKLQIFDKLKIKSVDSNCMDELIYLSDRKVYRIPEGKDNFIAYFQHEFPHEAKGIKLYVEKLWSIVDEISFFFLREENDKIYSHDEMFYWPADKVISHYIKDAKLQDILAYMNPMFGGRAGHTPCYVSALINRLYISGVDRFVGGSHQLTKLLTGLIEDAGGKVFLMHEVNSIETDDKKRRITAIKGKEKRKYDFEFKLDDTDMVVCDVAPKKLIDMTATHLFTKAFRARVSSAPASYSTFCLFIILKEKSFPYINHTCYMQRSYGKVWRYGEYNDEEWPNGFMYLTPCVENQADWAHTMVVNAPMPYSTCIKWEDTKVGNRGDEYIKWKKKITNKILDRMEDIYPGFRDKCLKIYSSSPLTIRDYLGNPEGGMYGTEVDCQNLMQRQMPIHTKISNLLMTGQNVYLHGSCGVPLTALQTSNALDYYME